MKTLPQRTHGAPAALSIEATADYLGVSVSSVWRLLRSGELPKAKIAGRTLVRRVDAEAFLARAVEGSAA